MIQSARPRPNAHRRREEQEYVLLRARFLDPPERALLVGAIDRGLTSRELADLLNLRPRAVRRRLQRLLEHVNDPLFRFVLRERETWPRTRRRVAEAVILRRHTQRRAAAELEITIHRVRLELHRIRTLHEAASRAERNRP